MRDWMGARPAAYPRLRLAGNAAGRTSGRPAGLPHGPHKDARRACRRPHPAPPDLPGADGPPPAAAPARPWQSYRAPKACRRGRPPFGRSTATPRPASPGRRSHRLHARRAGPCAVRGSGCHAHSCVAHMPACGPLPVRGEGGRPRMAPRSAVRRDRTATSHAGLRAAWRGASGAGRTGRCTGMHGAGLGAEAGRSMGGLAATEGDRGRAGRDAARACTAQGWGRRQGAAWAAWLPQRAIGGGYRAAGLSCRLAAAALPACGSWAGRGPAAHLGCAV